MKAWMGGGSRPKRLCEQRDEQTHHPCLSCPVWPWRRWWWNSRGSHPWRRECQPDNSPHTPAPASGSLPEREKKKIKEIKEKKKERQQERERAWKREIRECAREIGRSLLPLNMWMWIMNSHVLLKRVKGWMGEHCWLILAPLSQFLGVFMSERWA